jgi:hypothetical protein
MNKMLGRIFVIVVILFMSLIGYADEPVQYGVVYSGTVKAAPRSFCRPVPRSEWTDSVKVWLARSCVGEAGFDAQDECIGIAWVYAARYNELKGKVSLASIIRRYSSAVKKRGTHKRPWILSLSLDGKRPRGWPENLSWSAHRSLWMKILSELDHWADGNRDNPVAGANHYGGNMDTPGRHWVRVSPKNGLVFRNTFYRSRF